MILSKRKYFITYIAIHFRPFPRVHSLIRMSFCPQFDSYISASISSLVCILSISRLLFSILARMSLCPTLHSYTSMEEEHGCRSLDPDVSSSAHSSYPPSASWRHTRVTWSPSSLSPPSSSPSTHWRRWSSKTR